MTDNKTHWTFDKRLGITHFLTTAALVASVFVWTGKINQRIDHNTQSIEHSKEVANIEQQHLKNAIIRLEHTVTKFDDKLDTVLSTSKLTGP